MSRSALLRCYNSYRERFAEFSFWRLSTGVEAGFIVNDLECAIECRSSASVQSHHLKGMRELAAEHPRLGRKIVVCCEPKSRRTSDGIDILPVADFVATLWSGALF